MSQNENDKHFDAAREKFLGLSLESTRKSYYPQLKKELDSAIGNERKLQLLIDNIPARVCYVDREERYVLVNSQYEKGFGLTRNQVLGEKIKTIAGGEHYRRVQQYIRDALAGEHVTYEIAINDFEGETKWIEVSYVPDVSPQGEVDGFYMLGIDRTEKKQREEEKEKLEHQLSEVQKIKAIGTLAGGIAHDFNNLLMAVQGRTSLMAEELEQNHPLFEHVEAIEEHIESAANLTRQLLGFARGGKYEVKAIDINRLLAEGASMFGRTHKEISIHKSISSSPLVVEADCTQLEQVFLNMYVNAWQAMEDGGNLFLESGALVLDPILCRANDLKEGIYVKIVIADDGAGMSSLDCDRVFDPFFTTKEKQRGTGLGLASAYGIIKNHGGLITVKSTQGAGTSFSIYLPLSEKPVEVEPEKKTELIKGKGTILLVDDEEMILNVGRAMLERLGYRVLTAQGGVDAVEVVSGRGGEIDLVILDLIMPVLDGGLTFDRIMAIQPGMSVLLSSGYSLEGQAQDIIDKGCNGFIQKPFSMAALSQAIDQVLDRS
jgi:two-component system cell cycle sensor histidine kinase/response regulator CckA